MYTRFLVRSNHERMILLAFRRYHTIASLGQHGFRPQQWERFYVTIKRPETFRKFRTHRVSDAVPAEPTVDESSVESTWDETPLEATTDEVPSESVEETSNIDHVKHALERQKADTLESEPMLQSMNEAKELQKKDHKTERLELRVELRSAKQRLLYNVYKDQKFELLKRPVSHVQHTIMQNILQTYFDRFCISTNYFKGKECVPFGQHFIHLNDQDSLMESDLSDDGYDAIQSPGKEWFRRLWGGGMIRSPKDAYMKLDSKICIENKVRKVRVTGNIDDEKMFVEFERHIYNASDKHKVADEHDVEPLLTESRTLVYMKQPFVPSKTVKSRRLKMNLQPGFCHELSFTPITVFRYSALTYNAHRVHYDIDYARLEGYEGLLVQGPLQVTFVLELLRLRLLRNKRKVDGSVRQSEGADFMDWDNTVNDDAGHPVPNPKWKIESFEYKNIAPLYVGQRVKLCGKLLEAKGTTEIEPCRTYQLWIEGARFGELYMRGRAKVISST